MRHFLSPIGARTRVACRHGTLPFLLLCRVAAFGRSSLYYCSMIYDKYKSIELIDHKIIKLLLLKNYLQ
jgi:hypothetical protein